MQSKLRQCKELCKGSQEFKASSLVFIKIVNTGKHDYLCYLLFY